jgi:hypothetical protein
MLFGCTSLLLAASVDARSSYDGSWNIIFCHAKRRLQPNVQLLGQHRRWRDNVA